MPVKLHVATWSVFTEVMPRHGGTPSPGITTSRATTARQTLNHRYKMLRAVVKEAFSQLTRPDNLPVGTDYLRLFLAPEYYFSRTMEDHLIPYRESQGLRTRLRNLSKSPIAKDVLFVPGTIAYYKPYLKSKADIKGSPRARTKKYQKVLKTAKRGKIDKERLYLAHNAAFMYFNGRQVFSYRKHMDASEVSPNESTPQENSGGIVLYAPGTGSNVFKMMLPSRTLDIGIEICADHSARVLERTKKTVDILLIPHATVTVRTSETSVKPGGYVIEASGGIVGINRLASKVWKKGGGGALSPIPLNSQESLDHGRPSFRRSSTSRNVIKRDKKSVKKVLPDNLYRDYKSTLGGILQLFELDYP